MLLTRRKVTSTGIADGRCAEQLVLGLLGKAEQGGASTIAIIDRRPVQIVIMPVRRPSRSHGW